MEVTRRLRAGVRAHTGLVAVILTVIGYALVLNAFQGIVQLPRIGEETVRLFSWIIVGLNLATLTALLAGVYFIRHGDVARHRIAMVTAVAIEMVFLLLYVWKVGGGGELYIEATGLFKTVYLLILAVHLIASALSVPFVIYAVLLGLTHTPSELSETPHARVGRIAATVWAVSLFLGLVTSAMLRIAGSNLETVGMLVWL